MASNLPWHLYETRANFYHRSSLHTQVQEDFVFANLKVDLLAYDIFITYYV